jgi:membrane-associated phospholipid phosphatase
LFEKDTSMPSIRLAGLVCALGLMVSGSGSVQAESQFLLNAGTAGALGVPLVAGIISIDHADQEGLQQLLYTYGATMGTTLLLKKTVDATRPNGEPESFPSGHAASAFAGAAYLQRRYGWTYGVPAYAVGAFVGYTRVENDKHYWRDVAASAAIASLSAYFFTTPAENGVQVALIADPTSKEIGLSATLQF